MKALILSCNTGQGHNSCSEAIREVFDEHGEKCDIVDGLSFISPRVSRTICRHFVQIYRYFPGMFRWGYSRAELHPKLFSEHSLIYRFMGIGSRRLYEHIQNGGYDKVICPHVLTALMLTIMQKRYKLPITTAFVATDYTCSPSAKDSALDLYFIPGEKLKDEFICDSITPEKLIYSGIPVRKMFRESTDMFEAKHKLGISPLNKHLLIMCGSMGCGPISKLAERLKLPPDCEVTVVCGTNNRLESRLKKAYSGNASIHIRGYVSDMSMLMDSADLYVTKPGGLSITEAAVKGLPMVFVNTVAGCEEHNLEFFVSSGGAKTADTTDAAARLCKRILKSDRRLLRMRNALIDIKKDNAAEIIYETMKNRTVRNEVKR